MSSSNRRQRELARAKRERQAARVQAGRSRQNLVIALAGVAVLVIAAWLVFKPSGDSTAEPSASPTGLENCQSAPVANPSPAQFEKPVPTREIKGKFLWTLHTNCGDIDIQMFGNKAPVTVGSFEFLTSQNYFDEVPCHRLTTAGLFVLQCGDPTGTGTGGPGYAILDENLPAAAENNYPAGTVAMANSGPNTGGSQFFIVYKDTTLGPDYTIFGQVVAGLDRIVALADLGVVGGGSDGAPLQGIGIRDAEFEPWTPAKESDQ